MQTEDLATVYCLRSLAKYAQKTGNNQIPWANTKDNDWEDGGHAVTFHFDRPQYRLSFERAVERVLRDGLCQKLHERDDDPAVPAR